MLTVFVLGAYMSVITRAVLPLAALEFALVIAFFESRVSDPLFRLGNWPGFSGAFWVSLTGFCSGLFFDN